MVWVVGSWALWSKKNRKHFSQQRRTLETLINDTVLEIQLTVGIILLASIDQPYITRVVVILLVYSAPYWRRFSPNRITFDLRKLSRYPWNLVYTFLRLKQSLTGYDQPLTLKIKMYLTKSDMTRRIYQAQFISKIDRIRLFLNFKLF